MIKFGNVTKRYASKIGMITALDHVDLTISKGEWTNICGEGRSGKTTILKSLMGRVRVDSGEIDVAGYNLMSLPREHLKKLRQEWMGYVSKETQLLPQYSVLDNVTLPLIPYKRKSVIQERANFLLERLGVIHHRGHLPDQLNADEKRRVSLARALMNEPHILLLDEIFDGLEEHSQENLLGIIGELHHNGYTIVNVTKDAEWLKRRDHTYFLEKGRLKEAVLH